MFHNSDAQFCVNALIVLLTSTYVVIVTAMKVKDAKTVRTKIGYFMLCLWSRDAGTFIVL